MIETWLPIPGFPGYEVSDLGRVRSFRSGTCRILKPSLDKKGYAVIHLSGNTPKFVHRLVMLAFAGECPPGLEVCHNDSNPANNNLSNLRYDTRKGNLQDAVRNGSMGKGLQTEQIVNLYKEGHTIPSLAKMFNVSRASIYHHLNQTPPLSLLEKKVKLFKKLFPSFAHEIDKEQTL